jgi:hypothetical protein
MPSEQVGVWADSPHRKGLTERCHDIVRQLRELLHIGELPVHFSGVPLGGLVDIHTDEFSGYQRVGKSYPHEKVNHSKDEYSRNGVTTNGIESVFAVLKRGLHGVYHHASPKPLGRYVDEFIFRLNEGNVRRHTWDRLDSFVDAIAGKRLTYERLTQ